jgi:hypothetical protein|tara:strand:- start:309 stop:704 length:396 start_codon:yes stop_codon:yes gene_type:complete
MKLVAGLAILCFLLVACSSGVSQTSITGSSVAVEAVEEAQEEVVADTPTPSGSTTCDAYNNQVTELNNAKNDLTSFKSDMIGKLNAHESASGAQKTELETQVDELTKKMNVAKDTITLLQKQVDALSVECS